MSKASENHINQSLETYLQEIGQVPLLTPEKEIELTQQIKQGNQQALEELTEANLLFVVSVAKKYQNKGLSLGDLINEGNLGLMIAAKRFDETRGFKFISYAVWWIRQGILQALAQNTRVVRIPLNRVSTLTKIVKTSSKLEQELEREPTVSEIANQIDKTDIEVAETQKVAGHHLSMDLPFNKGENNTLHDVIENGHQPSPDTDLINESLRIEIKNALATLTGREAEILRLYFGLDQQHSLTLEEIGERFNLTRERIRQIKEKALRRLGHSSRSEPLRKFLG